MNLLNCDVNVYAKKLKIRKIIAIAVPVAVLIINVLLSVFRTDETHVAFLALNIVTDIACGWFLIAWYFFAISLQNKMLKLALTEKSLTQTVEGVATDVSEKVQMVSKLQCFSVVVENETEKRVVFVVKNCGLRFEAGKKYSVTLADNIAINAEVKA